MDRAAIIRFQLQAHQLLSVHYGMTLSDTRLRDDTVVSRLIEAGISATSAVNDLVDKSPIKKRNAAYFLPMSLYVSGSEI